MKTKSSPSMVFPWISPEGSLRSSWGRAARERARLLHLIGGLDRPTSGELLVDQRLVGQMADDQVTLFRRTQIGFIFQFFNLLPTLTALENVTLAFCARRAIQGRGGAES